MGLLRLVGSGAGVVAIFAGLFASIGEDEGSSSSSAGDTAGLIAVVALTPVLVSAVYDIFTAPRAARRANEQHGLTTLSLVPVPIPGRSSASPGLALVGQF